VIPSLGVNYLGVGILVIRSGIAIQSQYGTLVVRGSAQSGRPLSQCEVLLEDE
jgi:hypothetical protein